MPSRLFTAVLLAALTLAGLHAKAQAPVRVEPAAAQSIVQFISVPGTVTSPRTSLLSTAVAGLVAELAVEEGRRVDTGEALLKLDDELAALALERLLADVRRAETALADAKRRLAEAEEVGPARGVARTAIESLRAEVSSDEAALLSARAAAQEQRALVDRHTLRAPFAGVISQRFAELGEWVNPGDGMLELVATDRLRFDFRIAQDYFGKLARSTSVGIRLDALPDTTLEGRVDTIVPVKDPGARTFLVRVLADAGELSAFIAPGMSVGGRFNLDTGRQGVAVSRDAILRFPDGRVTVWVVESPAEAPLVRERVVETGLEFDGLVEIVDGLVPGELVVVRGNETLQDGQAVTILGKES